jgi:anti-sigma factor RsiW
MSNREIQHLQDDDLLRLLDGELPEGEVSALQSHLEACWKCRTRREEFEIAIGEYVRYRESALKPSLPPPPASWSNLRRKFEELDRALAPPRLLPVVRPARLFRFRPAYWVTAAACAILVFVLVRRVERPPVVSAAELLRKAVAAQSSLEPRRLIQIKTHRRTFLRPASLKPAVAAAETAELQQMFDAAPFSWEDPLNAQSYAAWHDHLPAKRDQVETIDRDDSTGVGVYVVKTSTSASTLRTATLTLRARDLRPLREMLEFTNETVEITDLPQASGSEIAETPAKPGPGTARAPMRATEPRSAPSTVGQKLEVFLALHRIGADLGEPVEIRQSGDQLVVIGTGLTAPRQEQLRAALSQIPGVEVRFDEAKASPRSSDAPGGKSGATTAPMQPRLQALLGGRESAEDFTNRALDASDMMMAHLHALRALARAFPADIERNLASGDQGALKSLRNDHSMALSQRVADLQRILKPVIPQAPVATVPESASNWQSSAEALFAIAQQFDDSLNASLAGPGAGEDSGFAKLAVALSHLQSQLASYERASR